MSISSTMRAAVQTARSRATEKVSPVSPDASPIRRAYNAATVVSVVVIGVVALIGILIYAQIEDALPAPENTDLAASQDAVTDGFGGAMELVPIVLLVLIAALVIGVVQRMR